MKTLPVLGVCLTGAFLMLSQTSNAAECDEICRGVRHIPDREIPPPTGSMPKTATSSLSRRSRTPVASSWRQVLQLQSDLLR